jgi:hypothetical protein
VPKTTYAYIIINVEKTANYYLPLRALTGLPDKAAPSITIILSHAHFTPSYSFWGDCLAV